MKLGRSLVSRRRTLSLAAAKVRIPTTSKLCRKSPPSLELSRKPKSPPSSHKTRKKDGAPSGFAICFLLGKRFSARSGNQTFPTFFIGLTLPIQRVINARFALGIREQGLCVSTLLSNGSGGVSSANSDAAKLQHSLGLAVEA